MFSLIITVIAIALVAALALATLYYGGPIFNEGAERAQAAKLSAQGQQIMGAMELYRAEKGVYPQSLNDLVADEYLKSIPVAQAEEAKALASAFAASTTWTLSSPGQPVIVLKPVSLATCKAYNQANVGVSGVLQQAHSTKLKQCVGTDVNNLMIIQPKAAADLIYVSTDPAAVVQIGAVLNTPIPTLADTTPNGWLDLVGGPVLSYFGTDGVTPLASLTFGDTETGATSAAATVLVKNTGASAFNFAAQSATIGAPFQILDNTCSGALAAGTSCVVSVTFSPAAAQAYSGPAYALQLASTNSGTRTFAVSGTGISTLSAADCLVAPGSSNIVFNGSDPYFKPSGSAYLVNQCARPLEVIATEDWYSPVVWGFSGYSASRDGTSTYLPTFSFGGSPSPTIQGAGALTLTVTTNIFGGALGDFTFKTGTEDSTVPNGNGSTITTSASSLNLYVEIEREANYAVQYANYMDLQVRFADEPASPYVSKTMTFSGALAP
jgi:type II secretory pathway pseudopilin PulG